MARCLCNVYQWFIAGQLSAFVVLHLSKSRYCHTSQTIARPNLLQNGLRSGLVWSDLIWLQPVWKCFTTMEINKSNLLLFFFYRVTIMRQV